MVYSWNPQGKFLMFVFVNNQKDICFEKWSQLENTIVDIDFYWTKSGIPLSLGTRRLSLLLETPMNVLFFKEIIDISKLVYWKARLVNY